MPTTSGLKMKANGDDDSKDGRALIVILSGAC